MTDITKDNLQSSALSQKTKPESIITQIVDGKTVNMKYNRYIDKYEQLPDEPQRGCFPDGSIKYEILPYGTSRGWFKNKQLKY